MQRMPSSVRLFPVGSHSRVHHQGNVERRHADHELLHAGLHAIELALGNLEHQLVVHLHDELGRKALLLDPVLHRDHGELDQVGGGSLHRRVDRLALGALAALLESSQTPYALIGGVAVQLHSREPRTTRDIDIAVPTFADVPKEALELAGVVYEGRFPHSDTWRAPGPGTRAERTPVQFSAEDVGIAFNTSDSDVWPTGYGRVGGNTVPYTLPMMTWACVEISYDGTNRVQQLFINGTQLIDATGYPGSVEALTYFKFGFDAYHGPARQMWYDDVAVTPTRIPGGGCPPS